MWSIRETSARSILSPVTGFLRKAGFTHSLSPARNCTYGCLYCYVPTMRFFGGLQPEDWRKWGQFTTLKTNAAELVRRELAHEQVIYCSPVVDPYQPAEAQQPLVPAILEAVLENPPAVFVIQTRGPLILRDLALLKRVAKATNLRISFSITTDRDDVRRRYEPHCESNDVRLETIQSLREEGLPVYATLAPVLPCNPEALVNRALDAAGRDLIGDPLHIRAAKPRGAVSRDSSLRIAGLHGESEWFEPAFQAALVLEMEQAARRRGFEFVCGPAGFGRLARR